MYGVTSLASHFPRSQTPSVTAGLKWAPEICPPAKTITMSAEPIANGANAPAPLPITVHPMVRTRKNVPINSAMYLFMPDLLQTLDARDLWKGLDLNELALYYQHVAQLSSAALNSSLAVYRTRNRASRA